MKLTSSSPPTTQIYIAPVHHQFILEFPQICKNNKFIFKICICCYTHNTFPSTTEHQTKDPRLTSISELRPILLLQLQWQIYLSKVLKPERAQYLNFGLLLRFYHQIQLLHPPQILLHEIFLTMNSFFFPLELRILEH